MSQNYIVPNIYSDLSNQYQGYFAFRFACQQCNWQIETRPVRSTVSTATNIMDIGAGFLNGFWGRAAEVGEKIYGSSWHTEQAEALQKAWAEVQPNFHYCSQCHRTVCNRCYSFQVNLCTSCAPDLKADAAQFQHHLNIDAQREQIQEQYHAPAFNIGGTPSAVTPDMLHTNQQAQQLPAPQVGQQLTPAALAGYHTPGYPQAVACSTCRRMGSPGKFCQDCGTKLPLPDLFCPQCSSVVESGSHFCPECGARLQQGA